MSNLLASSFGLKEIYENAMKKLFPLIILIFAVSVFGQVKPDPQQKAKTELEEFQAKYGAVVVQGYSKIGGITTPDGQFNIIAKEFKSGSAKIKGLVIEISTYDRYASSARSFVEYDEIDSLIKGITYISKIDKSVTALDSFEAAYKTKGDFSVTVFSGSDGTLQVSLSVGSYSSKSLFTKLTGLAELVTKLEQAKAILDGLK